MGTSIITQPNPQLKEWGTIQFEAPEFLVDTREKINDIAEILIAAMDVVLVALQFAKSFAVGYLDPLSALLDAVLAEINAFITDLRQIGIYIAGDWKLLDYPFSDLEGGYQAYERRMIGRLTDLSDPTRPDVSAFTEVLALFFYLSADASSVAKLVVFLDQLASFFRQSFERKVSQPSVRISSVKYGSDALDLLHPKSLTEAFQVSATPPSMVKVKWNLSPVTAESPYNPLPEIYPGGFIVSVSTLADGIKVVYDCPESDTTLEDPAAGSVAGSQVQPREYGPVRVQDKGAPLILYGEGVDLLVSGSTTLAYNYPESTRTGRARVYGQKVKGDDGIIPLEELRQSANTYIYQRTFLVPKSESGNSWFNGEFDFVLTQDDLPYTCTWETQSDGQIKPRNLERASTVYVRVAAVSERVLEGTSGVAYQFQSPMAKGGRTYVDSILVGGLGSQDLGDWSAPTQVTFPSADTQQYLEAVKVALLVLVLSRPDLALLNQDSLSDEEFSKLQSKTLSRPGEVLGLCGLEGMQQLAGLVYDDYQKSIEGVSDPVAFRAALRSSIERVAADIYNLTGPRPRVEKIVADQTQFLRTVTWDKIFGSVHSNEVANVPGNLRTATLWGSIDTRGAAGGDRDSGLGANPYSIGVLPEYVEEWFSVPGLIQDRDPHMIELVRGGTQDASFNTDMVIAAERAQEVLDKCPPGMRKVYERYIQADRSIVIPPQQQPVLRALVSRATVTGSADRSPVFYLHAGMLQNMDSTSTLNLSLGGVGVYYCRGIFAKAFNGQVLHEAAVALSLAGSAIQRSKKDGQWVSVRFLDILPGLDDFFSLLKNWLEAVQNSSKSVVDAILAYIQFVESRIVELQTLIRKVNEVLQELFGFTFQIPQCAALLLTSQGTAGVLGDFVTAKNKPQDSAQAYGAGMVVVIPYGPAFAMELVKSLFRVEQGQPVSGATIGVEGALTAIGGEEQVPPTPVDVPPDVL